MAANASIVAAGCDDLVEGCRAGSPVSSNRHSRRIRARLASMDELLDAVADPSIKKGFDATSVPRPTC